MIPLTIFATITAALIWFEWFTRPDDDDPPNWHKRPPR